MHRRFTRQILIVISSYCFAIPLMVQERHYERDFHDRKFSRASLELQLAFLLGLFWRSVGVKFATMGSPWVSCHGAPETPAHSVFAGC